MQYLSKLERKDSKHLALFLSKNQYMRETLPHAHCKAINPVFSEGIDNNYVIFLYNFRTLWWTTLN